MPDLFLGVDAGGTKTHAAVMDASGRLLSLGVAATGHWERVGIDGSAAALTRAIDDALAQCGHQRSDVTSASFALAGIDWDSDIEAMQRVVAGFGLGCAPVVMNDAIAVLLAGTDDGIGCASVAGTGGKTVARDATTTLATLGMSLGEGGGAGQVVAETLAALAQAYHGQRPPTVLTQAALESAGLHDEPAFFEAIARDGHRLSESFAPTVFALAEVGDQTAIDILQRVAEQHASDVVGLVNRLDFDGRIVPLVCAGGLHTAGSTIFSRAFERALAGSRWPLQTVVLDVVPVVGALVDSVVRANGSITGEQRAALIASASALDEDDTAMSSGGIRT
jgi:N-acetylglucosamine kinase-like BadF-type ATPase